MIKRFNQSEETIQSIQIPVKAHGGHLVPGITVHVTIEEKLFNLFTVYFIFAVLEFILTGPGELLMSCAKNSKSAVFAGLLIETKANLLTKITFELDVFIVRIPWIRVLGRIFWRVEVLLVLLDSPELAR